MRAFVIGGVALALLSQPAASPPALSQHAAAEPTAIKIGYLGRTDKKATISLLDIPPNDDGVAGVRLALDDNNTTGKFLNQRFSLEDVRIKESDDAAAIVSQLADRGISYVIADLPAETLLKVADAGRSHGLVFFNAGATDDRLREEDCRANVIHVAPTRSMLADALAQYLVVKRWPRWLLVVGSHDADKLYADGAAARRRAVRRQDRAGTGVRGHRRRAAHRQRTCPDPAPDPALPAGGSRLRRARRRRRERGVRVLSTLSYPGAASGRRLGRAHSQELGCRPRSVGREPAAEPLHPDVLATNDRTRRRGLDRGAHDRRGRLAGALRATPRPCSNT